MAKHFKGEFLVSKIVATIIILGFMALMQFGVISNLLNGLFICITLVVFFIVDSKLRKRMDYD